MHSSLLHFSLYCFHVCACSTFGRTPPINRDVDVGKRRDAPTNDGAVFTLGAHKMKTFYDLGCHFYSENPYKLYAAVYVAAVNAMCVRCMRP